MSFKQESVRKTVELERKVDKTSRFYGTYNYDLYLSKTH